MVSFCVAKFSREKANEIVNLMRGGASQGRAAELAGVSSEAIRLWRRRGEREDAQGQQSDYTSFAVAVGRIEASVLAQCERTLVRSATVERNVGSAKWLLSRLLPEYRSSRWFEWEVREAVQRLLEDVAPHMSEEAYGELLHAIASVHGFELEPCFSEELGVRGVQT